MALQLTVDPLNANQNLVKAKSSSPKRKTSTEVKSFMKSSTIDAQHSTAGQSVNSEGWPKSRAHKSWPKAAAAAAAKTKPSKSQKRSADPNLRTAYEMLISRPSRAHEFSWKGSSQVVKFPICIFHLPFAVCHFLFSAHFSFCPDKLERINCIPNKQS